MKSFADFYKGFGLDEYPFSIYNTENEKGKEDKLFIKPLNYSPIVEAFSGKRSMILVGERGTGKTAMILEFIRNLDSSKDLICQIDDYSDLSNPFKQVDFYKFLLSKISTALFNNLAANEKKIKKLNNEERVLLSYLLKEFVPTISKRVLGKRIEEVQKGKKSNFFRKTYNNVIRPFANYSATVGGAAIEVYLAKHFKSLPPINETINIHEIFPEFPATIDESFKNQKVGYQLLNETLEIIEKMEFERIVVFMDKVDEDSRIQDNGERVAKFITPIVTNNKLLLNNSLQIVLSLWQTPFSFLKDKIRTQKHYCPTLKWQRTDLENALNKRLEVYSNGKINNYKDLFHDVVTREDIDLLFELANNNPRDLYHLFNSIFQSQYGIHANVTKILKPAIQPAIENFIQQFNYYEYYPKKLNARANSLDFFSYSNYLVKLGDAYFTKSQLNAKANIGSSIGNYVVGMERIGLIEKDSQESGEVKYRIKDPKVIYAMKNNISIQRN